ncbi:MAG TPA: hypothetical protein PK509_16555, partial [Catalimonadaceae bacterium]|nr:hypothetical protein [Catalimonadaceae bacterium]
GSQGNYPTFDNKTQTFCSNNGQHIQFNFNNKAFNVIDTLWVYDGNSVNSNLVGIYINGSYVEPLTSSGTCLTFRFKSGPSSSSGWASLINCVTDVPSSIVYPMSSGTRSTCSGIFTDDGGLSNNYSASVFRTQTFQSPTGERLRFVFQNFTMEPNVDYLDIYDGPSVYYPRIARLTGTIAAGTTFTSTGNTLTFTSNSNSSTTYAGWAATIQCAGPALTTYNMSSGTVNTCSGVFYDNNGGGAAYSPNENRTQTFCSDNGQHVVFDFTNFEIGNDNDSLFVYDGNSVNAPLLGVYLNFSLPEKITSEGTCLTFRFKSTASSQWNGWKAIISCSGADPASLTYPMASGVRATCGGVFADDGGLTLNYSSNQNRVQTFQSKAGQRIRFNFQQFALENNGDFLRIYDGPTVNSPLIGIFTGSLSPGIISSSGNSVTFWFTSNGSTSGNFAATIDCFDQALTAYNMSSGTTTTCSGMFYDNGGVSANYPLAENRTQTFCSGSTQKLQFTFNNLAFRMSTGDTLWAYDGNSTNSTLLGYYISNSYVETITSSGTCITFRFKSDFSSATVDQGWVSQITCTSVTPPALIYRMSSGLRVTCSGIFTDEGGLTGNYFDFPSYRTQTFQSPTNSRLQFEFTQFQTHSNSDVLYVYDGPNESYPLIGTYAVNNNPGTILSSGNSLTFSFYTNSSSNSTGWAANISCAGPALPIYIMSNNPVNACEGQWFDNGGLSNYPANTTVTQSFCSPTGQRMVFNFNFFGFLIGVNDSLLVYDGNSVNSPLKAVITGGMPIEPIVSSGSCITFRFKSTINSTQIGWSAKFSCSDNPSQPDVFPLSTGLRVACSGIFTDDGGLTGNYSDLVAKNLTFRSSTSGAKVQLSFSEFATQANSDVLYIYDGGTISSPLLGSYSGLNSPGIVTSTGSELTFRFVSSSS